MAAADTACYVAKDKGRNQVQVYHEDDEEVASRHGEMSWVSRITHAIEENRFFLHCQRVQSLSGEESTEYLELLLRMRDEHGRVVLPMSFIPAAERYHLMGAIDRWVVHKALRCLGRLHADGGQRELPLFGVNLSGMSIGDTAFADFVQQRFDESGAPPGSVCFEVTETAAISNLGRAARFIRRFRDLGCRFALDDFGTGLTSFAYLKSLPVDYIKIDGSFVRGSADDAVDHAVVDAIQRLARAVGAKTIAESVETPETLRRVRELGIDFGQGHAIHKPEPYLLLATRVNYATRASCTNAL
jgi:EAL domain-containing protein (putative c-di-GMP-specific phosphodiesterase class I)